MADDLGSSIAESTVIRNMLSSGKNLKPGVNRTVSSLVFSDKSSIPRDPGFSG